MTQTIKYVGALAGLLVFLVAGCKKDKPKTLPSVTTMAATAITSSSATSGGTITSNGNDEIMASGVCWSNTNNQPTIADDTTRGFIKSGEFTAILSNLAPSAIYYVRAYAINGVGIGYGDVVTMTTGNGAPTATAVAISGTPEVAKTLTATYTYNDIESDPENGTIFKWYVANDGAGTGETAIEGATASTFVVQAAQEGKYIRVGVIPKSSAGNRDGSEVKSAFVGAIGEANTVTFTYNGQSVTYGIITSGVTGRKWLDRNLGAPNTPASFDDFANYGDLFQWGRGADGHQLVIHNGNSGAETMAVNEPENNTLSSSDDPGHSNHIITASNMPGDWRDPQNDNLWQGVNGINNPCPSGWRIPTQQEWEAELSPTDFISQAYALLKVTLSGSRSNTTGNFLSVGANGRYWTSSVVSGSAQAVRLEVNEAETSFANNIRAAGMSCRCIKD